MHGPVTMPKPDPASVEPDDEALVRAHLAGDPSAFADLWRRHHQALLRYAVRLVGRTEVAEELVGEAFLRIARGRWRPQGKVRAWLFTVVHRLCLDRLRRRSRWAVVRRLVGGDHDVGPSPELPVLHAERDAALDRALDALATEHRAVVLLYYTEELPSREVADILGCTDQQVRSQLSYARRRLRELLEEER
ncbi:MAG: sigma-70 family RNA polymerase sigma factor [Alphaproteobacteria bacterium]|nr:sigma-70 family RNA polymerase sigma factor [Alphaproteobacteria bacterium]